MIDVVHPVTYRQALTWLFQLHQKMQQQPAQGGGAQYSYTVIR